MAIFWEASGRILRPAEISCQTQVFVFKFDVGPKESGLQETIISTNAAISACERSDEWQHALSIYLANHLGATTITFGAAISACESGSQWPKATPEIQGVWGVYSRFQGSIFRFSGVVESEAKALLLLQLQLSSLRASVRSFSAAISACASSGKWQHSLALLDEMEAAKMAANIITYNAAISACEKRIMAPQTKWHRTHGLGGLFLGECVLEKLCFFLPFKIGWWAQQCQSQGKQWSTALSIFKKLSDLSMQLTVVTYAACISACEKGGQWTRALQFFAEIAPWRFGFHDLFPCWFPPRGLGNFKSSGQFGDL